MKSENMRKHLRETFLELLEECPVDKITTKMILDEAGISRSTFYRLYEDKYSLMQDVRNTMLKDAIQVETSKSYEEFARTMLQFVKDHRKYYLNVFSVMTLTSTNAGFRGITLSLFEAFRDRVVAHRGSALSTYENYLLELWCAGSTWMLLQWALDGCRIDLELVANYSHQAAPDFVKAAFK